jgi:hypothetical protein
MAVAVIKCQYTHPEISMRNRLEFLFTLTLTLTHPFCRHSAERQLAYVLQGERAWKAIDHRL